MSPRRTALLPLLAACAVLGGCYSFAEPSLKPGDARDILMAMARRGIDVRSSVTGESACTDVGLRGNALHLVGSVASDPEPRDIYLYVFRVRSWEGSDGPVDACQAELAATLPGATLTRLDVPTYRVFGADWSPDLTEALRGALEEASQQGD